MAAGQATAPAQSPAAAAAAPPPADPLLTAAQNLVGRALFLRGFPSANSLAYDSAGALLTQSKPTDWTLAAVNVLKAARPSPGELELEGVRVAIRYNPDAHEFQRHPLNGEKIKLLLQLPSSPGPNSGPNSGSNSAQDPTLAVRQLQAAFAAIFAIGIDPALQRSMPPFWRHYFDPSVPWNEAGADPLAGQTIYPVPPLPPLPGPPTELVPPILDHQTYAQLTAAAHNDRVQGAVQLRLVVDASGAPQRIAIVRPLGYGLDQQAAESVAKWRFHPALHSGQPVPAAILINLDFLLPPTPPR
jgi:TonB family protein